MTVSPGAELVERVRRMFSPVTPIRWQRAERGYTPAERWVVGLDDGSTVFVKGATDEMTAGWLREEHLIYSQVDGEFLARMLRWEDDGARPVLVLEDLSAAVWPPPWTVGMIQGVMDALSRVRATIPPGALLALDNTTVLGWSLVADNPDPFLALGLCSQAWLDEALPVLLASDRAAPRDGDELVHLDVRSDNLCFQNGKVVLVDWNLACRANGLLDVAAWLPSLEAEGGPRPEFVSPEASVFAGLVSGYFAARAGLPRIETAPLVRRVQLEQLRTALPWAARALDLQPLRR